MRSLALFCLALLATPLHADDLEDAVVEFRRAAVRNDIGKKQAALDALVELGDPNATPALINAYASCVTTLREAEDEADQLTYVIRQRERTIADLELRAKKDESLEKIIRGQKTSLGTLQDQLRRKREKAGEEAPWREALAQGTRRLFDKVSDSQRRKAEKLIWNAIEESADLAALLAAVEMLGQVGAEGTAVDLQKLMAEVGARRRGIERKLPKKEAEVRKMEARMQKEADQSGGRMSAATAQQYNRVKAEATADRREVTLMGHVLDACVVSAATALARESDEACTKSLRTLTKAMRKAKDGTRLRSLSILASVPCAPAQAALREALAGERDPAAIARTLEDLALLGDRAIVDDLLGTYLDHEAWIVQTAAAHSLAALREKRGIPAMIERLGAAQGRLATDLREALCSLTGQDFHHNVELWQSWWKEHGDNFEVPPLEEADRVTAELSKAAGVTFFGIHTTSQRVLFILDLSGSMSWSMVPRGNPTDDPNQPPDLPRGGEISRLTAAKRDLGRAIGGLRDDARFNLVLYASDVWTWQDKMVVMEDSTRVAVRDYVDSLKANGGTNIYGALKLGLELAGADGGDEWSAPEIDTIFLLTDGRPSVGVTTDREQILDFVRELNQSAGIVIHTIGLSGAQDAYLLSKLAEQNGGTYASR
jgi:HEAT repeat protein